MVNSNLKSMFTKLNVGMVNMYGKINVLSQFDTDISLSEKRINDLV